MTDATPTEPVPVSALSGNDPSRGDVSDIADPELIRRVINYLSRKRGTKRHPLWDAVSIHFGLGSTYSTQLCRRFGFDPDEPAA